MQVQPNLEMFSLSDADKRASYTADTFFLSRIQVKHISRHMCWFWLSCETGRVKKCLLSSAHLFRSTFVTFAMHVQCIGDFKLTLVMFSRARIHSYRYPKNPYEKTVWPWTSLSVSCCFFFFWLSDIEIYSIGYEWTFWSVRETKIGCRSDIPVSWCSLKCMTNILRKSKYEVGDRRKMRTTNFPSPRVTNACGAGHESRARWAELHLRTSSDRSEDDTHIHNKKKPIV